MVIEAERQCKLSGERTLTHAVNTESSWLLSITARQTRQQASKERWQPQQQLPTSLRIPDNMQGAKAWRGAAAHPKPLLYNLSQHKAGFRTGNGRTPAGRDGLQQGQRIHGVGVAARLDLQPLDPVSEV